MNKTLFISDLDGTLLDDSAVLNDTTASIINELIEKGALFTCATGRSFTSAAKIINKLNLNLPVATYNGAFLVSPESGKIIEKHGISKTLIAELAENISNLGIAPLVYSIINGEEKVSWIKGKESSGIQNYVNSRSDSRMHPVESASQLYEGDVFYITIIGGESDLPALAQFVTDNPYVHCNLQQDTYEKHEYWLDIYNKNSSKEHAVYRLKEYCGADTVICFGDNINDIPMFRAADKTIAVSNAHDELKAIAHTVIGSNNDNSVAKWIKANYF